MIKIEDENERVSNENMKTQNIKLDSLQIAIDELNNKLLELHLITSTLNSNINDKYETQTRNLLKNLEDKISELKGNLENSIETKQIVTSVLNADNITSHSETVEESSIYKLGFASADGEELNVGHSQIERLDSENANIKNLSVESLELENLELKNSVSENVKSKTAIIEDSEIGTIRNDELYSNKINSELFTVSDLDEWHTPSATPDNTELLKLSIPFYDGILCLLTEQGEINLSLFDNAFLSYIQKSKYIYRIEFDNNKNKVDVYLQNIADSISFKVLRIGSKNNVAIESEIVEKSNFKSNVSMSSKTGIMSSIPIVYDDFAFFESVVVDELPEEGKRNVLYVIKDVASYIWNEFEQEFVELSVRLKKAMTEDFDFDFVR